MKRHAAGEGGDPFQQVHDEELHHEDERPPVGTEQLILQLKETADKLIRDQANRGDIKLLNTALKELRYAFKVFAPYRNRRKVTVFGSARLAPDHPAYQQAVAFGRRAAEAGYMDERQSVLEALTGIKRAGADIIITYHAKDAAQWLT